MITNYTDIEIEEKLISITEYNQNDQRWNFNKSANDVIGDFYHKAGYKKYAERANDCAYSLGMALRANSEGEFIMRLQSVFLCHLRMCPICQASRSKVWKNRLDRGIAAMVEDGLNYRYLFLTFTVKNCDVADLRQTLLGMSRAFKIFMKDKSVMETCTGYIKSTEVTRSKDLKAHPHFHILLAVKPSYFGHHYITQSKYVEIWRRALKVDYNPVVDIRPIKLEKDKTLQLQILKQNIKEVAKYMVKPMHMIGDGKKESRDFFIELSNQLKGIKATNLSGIFKEYVKSSEPTEEEILEANLEEIAEYSESEHLLAFNWSRIDKNYYQK